MPTQILMKPIASPNTTLVSACVRNVLSQYQTGQESYFTTSIMPLNQQASAGVSPPSQSYGTLIASSSDSHLRRTPIFPQGIEPAPDNGRHQSQQAYAAQPHGMEVSIIQAKYKAYMLNTIVHRGFPDNSKGMGKHSPNQEEVTVLTSLFGRTEVTIDMGVIMSNP